MAGKQTVLTSDWTLLHPAAVLVSGRRTFLTNPCGDSQVGNLGEERLSFTGLNLLVLQVDKRSQSFWRRVVLAVQEWEDALAPPPPLPRPGGF